jgi:hypothetical protein
MPTITPPFQRRITNPLQRPLSSDLNLQAFYDSVTQSYMSGIMFSASPSAPVQFPTGFVGNSFRCAAAVGAREVVVQRGIGFINQIPEEGIGGVAGVDVGQYVPVICEPDSPVSAGVNLAIADLAVGLERIDLVCVKAPNSATATENIGLLNPTSSTFSFQPKPTQFTENAFDTAFIQVVSGTATGGTPSAPSVPSGYLEIGRIYVPVGSASLANADIEDRRNVLIPHGGRSMPLSFSTSLAAGEVSSFSFGNNGIKAVVQPVYTSLSPSGYSKTFEVYVASAATDPAVFDLVAGGCASPAPVTLAIGEWYGMQVSVLKKETVSRASALPVFQIAGGTLPILGPTVAKFTVAVGPLVQTDASYIVIRTQDLDAYIVDDCAVRLSLFAQAT